ncbi:TPA: ATPase [Streptococcus suis]|nr:ATPase [Streptococcus suis]NQO46002.1 ATPase [Streptococcus suis]WNF84184.1 AAA family ATPase [Streptococcus suis]HEM3598603.1 ATPase [Streptococcus suis]HEM3608599.1 ATPase [Streptococcus suis]
MNRGSEFRKWDLHVHSPYTVLNNQFSKLQDGTPDIDCFIQKIKDENISAIGLTNYFNFSDNDFNLKAKLEEEGIATFLNLEVRLSNINKSDQLFDYHIIFDNTLDDDIVKNLLGELKANIGPYEKAFNRLSRDEIEFSANIDFKSLRTILEGNAELNGNYLKGFLSRGHGSATSDSDPKNQAVYEEICVNSDFIIHSSCNDSSTCKDPKCKHRNIISDREYWLRSSKYVRPLLQSSDSHSLEEIGTKYSWIKSDLTFEGLKQIIFEPEYRICVEKERPIRTEDELIIDKIQYDGETIFLSDNLNTIIGGRSTGKSTLLNSIAYKLNESESEGKYTFSDMENFHVFWKDGEEDDSRRIQYLPQEYMIQLANNTEKLNSLVNDIIQSKGLDENIKSYQQNHYQIDTEIKTLLNKFKENLQHQQNLIKPEFDKKATNRRIIELQEKRQNLLSAVNIDDEEKKKFEIDISSLKQLEVEKSQIEKDILFINDLFLPYLTVLSRSDLPLEHSSEIGKFVNDAIEDINQRLQEIFADKINIVKQRLNSKIIEITKKIDSIKNTPDYKKFLSYLQDNKELKKIEENIEKENIILQKLESYEKELLRLNTENNQLKLDIINKYRKYSEIRKDLLTSFDISESDLKITIDFYQKNLEFEFDYINAQGRSKADFIEKLNNEFDSMIDTIFEGNSLKFNGNKTKLDHIEKFFTTDFYSYKFDIEYQNDKFEQMSPGKKAFVVLKLILDFSNSRVPVLIDQPEDSLDNRAIYHELTTYIKQTKLRRQIIIVTHNPNIVVSGDCENVIVANQHSEDSPNQNNKPFDYKNGALEDQLKDPDSDFILNKKCIKEHVCEILEGGVEAFKRRENKYGIK